jgi:hypothetical protein
VQIVVGMMGVVFLLAGALISFIAFSSVDTSVIQKIGGISLFILGKFSMYTGQN